MNDSINMNPSAQIAKQFREVYFGGNWSSSNLKDNLDGITWQQATTHVLSLNTIAMLVFHINYYVNAVLKVLQGEPLNAHDKYSYDVPEIKSEEDWDDLINKTFSDAENVAALIEQMPANKLWDNFPGEKYGIYYRNLYGIVEHTHYHLGQIALIKKIILSTDQK